MMGSTLRAACYNNRHGECRPPHLAVPIPQLETKNRRHGHQSEIKVSDRKREFLGPRTDFIPYS